MTEHYEYYNDEQGTYRIPCDCPIDENHWQVLTND